MTVDRKETERRAREALKMLSGPSLNLVIDYIDTLKQDSLEGCAKPRARDETCRFQGSYESLSTVVALLRQEDAIPKTPKKVDYTEAREY